MIRPVQTLALIALLTGVMETRGDWRDDIGYTRLKLLLSENLPSGPAQGFSQAEATLSSDENIFEPDTANPNYSGKSFSHKSGSSGVSGHAEEVASYLYGNATSVVTGDFPVDLYLADDWLEDAFLKRSSENQPGVESRTIQNHSWIGTDVTASEVTEIDRRLDFAINRDGFVCTVGVNNGNSTTLPAILCQSYHTISVGLANGNHSAGFTTADGAGRIKPDIVAPADVTSFATPMVASSAGLLAAELTAIGGTLANADRPRIIKALLLASATRDTVASWSNTPATPLDVRFGAGELNLHHAYRTLLAGKTNAAGNVEAGATGWSADSVTTGSPKTWFFTIPPGPATPFGAALTWHRQVTSNRFGFNLNWNATLADLNLRLFTANGFTLGSPVAESLSTVDNVELIARTALPPGQYAVVVENTGTTNTPFALAWFSLPTVVATTAVPLAREIDGQAAQVTLHRSGDTALPLLVPLTVAGTAVAGTDFIPLPASITIPAGQDSVTMPITPISDNLAQGDRSVTVGIGADFALVRDETATAAVTIQDKPFDAWRFSHFSAAQLADPAISSETADPDGDQLANLIEYALASDPLAAGIASVTAGESSGLLVLSATKNEAATDIEWDAEVSGDLENWQPAVIDTNSPTTFEAHDPVPHGGAEKRFIRLKITRP